MRAAILTYGAQFHEQVSAAHHYLRICRNSCDTRFILCTRLSGSGGLRRAAPWSRLRIRSRYPAIRATSPRAAVPLTSRRVPLRGISRDAPLWPTSAGPIWGTSRRMRPGVSPPTIAKNAGPRHSLVIVSGLSR